jgi:rare lipoprotein A
MAGSSREHVFRQRNGPGLVPTRGSEARGPWGQRAVRWLRILLVAMAPLACTKAAPPSRPIPPSQPATSAPRETPKVQEGVASWYGPGFHGNRTSSGETYDMYQMTAAHQTLPLGTRVLVTNLENSRTVEVVVNDRGPFAKERVIDLSYSAARVLEMVGPGIARVRVEILESPRGGPTADFSMKPIHALQLGAFSREDNAKALQADLNGLLGKGSARVVQAHLGSQDVYRVRVGRFAQKEEAMAVAQDLAKRGYVVLVVPEYAQ